jgi:hypothetical protein
MRARKKPTIYRWNLPPDLQLRTATYARRMQIRDDQVVELAVSEFFISNPYDWRNALSILAEVALGDYIEVVEQLDGIGYLEKVGAVSQTNPKTELAGTELPENRWNLPPDLNVLAATWARRLQISRDELMHVALRDFFNDRSMPREWVEELSVLVALALTRYLDHRGPHSVGSLGLVVGRDRQLSTVCWRKPTKGARS